MWLKQCLVLTFIELSQYPVIRLRDRDRLRLEFVDDDLLVPAARKGSRNVLGHFDPFWPGAAAFGP